MENPLGKPGPPAPRFKSTLMTDSRKSSQTYDAKQKKKGKGNWPYIKARRGLRRNMFRG